ncbi:MAG: hypothetical protein ABSB86_02880 [Bryobacteraceae bacterium]|jgi:hypothetical protein
MSLASSGTRVAALPTRANDEHASGWAAFSRHLPMLAAGAFALIWVTFRADLQSVTLDEADSYLGYVAPSWPSHWYPSSGNHVLNSILIRLLTWVFGLSHLTLRAPALLGGAFYVTAAYRLCRLISDQRVLAFPLFVCFVYNPFVMDYMVAARGYGLALGLLMIVVFLAARQILRYTPGHDAALRRDCVAASVCAGLSLCANFSFAYADCACILLFWLWACREALSTKKERWRLAAALSLPGLLAAFAIAGSVVWDWPKGQLFYGARSLSQGWHSIINATFYQLNPTMVNPLLAVALMQIKLCLPLLAVGLCISQFVLLSRESRRGNARLLTVAEFAGAAAMLTLALHWLQFKFFRIPLPMERTGLFFVPLSLLMWGSVTAIERRGRAGRILQRLSVLVLFLGATYFVGCLRLMYFHEWAFGADVRAAFPVLQDVARRYGVSQIPTTWEYSASLNFYRAYFHDNNLESFGFTDPPLGGKAVYVLPYANEEPFIRQQKLRVVYRGERSDLTILVRDDKE